MAEDTLPPHAPDPETIAAAEENPDPLLRNPPHIHAVSDPTDPIGRREDATKRGAAEPEPSEPSEAGEADSAPDGIDGPPGAPQTD